MQCHQRTLLPATRLCHHRVGRQNRWTTVGDLQESTMLPCIQGLHRHRLPTMPALKVRRQGTTCPHHHTSRSTKDAISPTRDHRAVLLRTTWAPLTHKVTAHYLLVHHTRWDGTLDVTLLTFCRRQSRPNLCDTLILRVETMPPCRPLRVGIMPCHRQARASYWSIRRQALNAPTKWSTPVTVSRRLHGALQRWCPWCAPWFQQQPHVIGADAPCTSTTRHGGGAAPPVASKSERTFALMFRCP
jgi:hypothetical protein